MKEYKLYHEDRLMSVFPSDQEWLDAVNGDRKRAGQDRVSYEIFEIIMDRLEKEWFDLVS